MDDHSYKNMKAQFGDTIPAAPKLGIDFPLLKPGAPAAPTNYPTGMAGHGMTASAIALLCTALEPRAKDDDDIASCLVTLTAQAAEIARLKEALEAWKATAR